MKLMAILLVMLLSGCATPRIGTTLTGSGRMADSPAGYDGQCNERPTLAICGHPAKVGDWQKFDDLLEVNSKYNGFRGARTGTYWEPIGESGTCTNYAVAKYEELIRRGWPAKSLRLATAYTENNSYHAVLLVEFVGQTWVLDNLHYFPIEYQLLRYRWDRLQVAGTRKWEKL